MFIMFHEYFVLAANLVPEKVRLFLSVYLFDLTAKTEFHLLL